MNDFKNNEDMSRFEYFVNDHIVFADYRCEEDMLYIDYVEAPPALRGTGAAGRLMQFIVDYAAERGLQIEPVCGYAVAWIRRNT